MKRTTLQSVFVAVFAALISVCCFIAIPVGPGGIPIVLQNMMVILSACILGSIQGAAAAGLFLIAGALGLPIFSGGNGGFAVIAGPTGGFLIGYFIGALVTGFIVRKPTIDEKSFSPANLIRITVAAFIGYCVIYIPGVLYFMNLTGKSFGATMVACVIPFIPGDLIKLVITVPVAAKLRPITARYLLND